MHSLPGESLSDNYIYSTEDRDPTCLEKLANRRQTPTLGPYLFSRLTWDKQINKAFGSEKDATERKEFVVAFLGDVGGRFGLDLFASVIGNAMHNIL